MFPFPINKANVAVVIINLQKGYCDPQGDAAHEMGWDCAPMHEACERHVPFVDELRSLLPPNNIIWTRMEEHEDTIAPNTSFKNCAGTTRLCVRGTPGFDYHIVQPTKDESEVFTTHPSVFHNDALVGSVGFDGLIIKVKYESLYTRRMSLHKYLQDIGVDTLVFTGALASRCVYASIIVASNLGYQCLCVTDLVAMPGGERFQLEAAMHETTRNLFFTTPITSGEFLTALKQGNNSAIKNVPETSLIR